MKAKVIGYWMTTGMLAFVLLSGGAAELMHRPETIQGMTQLGYPPYFTIILGVWKVLGGIAILAPRLPRLKEWAYAGAFFDLTGAAISHAVCGSSVSHVATTVTFALCTIASWALRPESRTLGSILPAAGPELNKRNLTVHV